MTITRRSRGPRNAYCQPRVGRVNHYGTHRPLANVQEGAGNYTILIQVPGWSKDEINISLDKNTLTILGKPSEMYSEKADSTIRREFIKRPFERSFILPKQANTDGIDAKFQNGILSIDIQKKEEIKGENLRTITIS